MIRTRTECSTRIRVLICLTIENAIIGLLVSMFATHGIHRLYIKKKISMLHHTCIYSWDIRKNIELRTPTDIFQDGGTNKSDKLIGYIKSCEHLLIYRKKQKKPNH